MFVNIIYMYSNFIPYFYANIVNKVLIIIIIIIVTNVFMGGLLENQLVDGQPSLKELDIKKRY